MSIPQPLQTLFWAVIPAVLLLVGQQLADKQTREDVALAYSLTRMRVGSLAVAELQLRNISDVAIDEITIAPPKDDLMAHQFEPAGSSVPSNPKWTGSLRAGDTLKGLFVFQGPLAEADEFVKSAVNARYRERKAGLGGMLDWNEVPLHETGIGTTLSSYVLYGLGSIAKRCLWSCSCGLAHR
jgi:hypothetical protein